MLNFFSTKVWKFKSLLYLCTYLQTKVVKNMDNISFRQRIINMQRGESITIPVEQVGYTTIRSYASDLGFIYKRRYSTHRNRETRTYTITRIA